MLIEHIFELRGPGSRQFLSSFFYLASFYIFYIFFYLASLASFLSRQFLCYKILLKKLATVKEMLIEHIFELRGPGSLVVYVLLSLVVFMTEQ